ncbi:MAG TPA: dipeptidase [Mesotoga infera]|uniref:Dipeptidase n=1 Tax=Mesotoga infera TaxID=1236046 RepID=A0A7C1H9C7_9BACT|nr:dipeptidase [Mesotoga infera]
MKASKVCLLFIFVIVVGASFACTTLIVTKGASADGSMIVAHSDDNDLADQRIVYVPAQDHEPGSFRPVYCTAVAIGEFPQYNSFIYPRIVSGRAHAYDTSGYPASIPIGMIPQAAHTYAYFDGSYGIMNEHQLMFGECTNGAKIQIGPEPGRRIFYSSELSRVALERCKTAREAVELIGFLIEEYGYYGTGETLPVADPNEAWIIEMAPSPEGTGGLWVAKKVPDGEVFVAANQFRIREIDPEDSDFLFGKTLHEVAERYGWWNPEDGLLDWLQTVSLGEYNHPYYSLRRVWRLFSLISPSLNLSPWVEDGFTREYPFSIKPDRRLSANDVMNLYRDHYEGTEFDLTKGIAAGPFGYPDRFYGPYDGQGDVGDPTRQLEGAWERPVSVTYCGYTFVCQGREWLPNPIGGIMWLGLDKPADTCFIPFYSGVSNLPDSIQVCDTSRFSRDSAWWAFNFVSNWAALKYSYMHEEIKLMQQKYEAFSLSRLPEIEASVAAILPTKPGEAADYLARFCSRNSQEIVRAWWEFSEYLIVKYNDGFISEKGNMAQPTGYPKEWLDKTDWSEGPTSYEKE